MHRLRVVNNRVDAQVWVFFLQLGHYLARAFGHRHFASAFAAENFKGHHFGAVLRSYRSRFAHRVHDLGNLLQAHMAAVRQRQVQLRQLLRALHRGNGAHRLLGTADITTPARRLDLHHFQAA